MRPDFGSGGLLADATEVGEGSWQTTQGRVELRTVRVVLRVLLGLHELQREVGVGWSASVIGGCSLRQVGVGHRGGDSHVSTDATCSIGEARKSSLRRSFVGKQRWAGFVSNSCLSGTRSWRRRNARLAEDRRTTAWAPRKASHRTATRLVGGHNGIEPTCRDSAGCWAGSGGRVPHQYAPSDMVSTFSTGSTSIQAPAPMAAQAALVISFLFFSGSLLHSPAHKERYPQQFRSFEGSQIVDVPLYRLENLKPFFRRLDAVAN
jgi:hypothetical protein